ncbi:MAG: hypothetical protein R3B45_07915 [Bdellovibrionota bacterium]
MKQEFIAEHFEIPLKHVEHWFIEGALDPKLKESLIFEKNNEKWVRWLINPEDTYFANSLEKYLKRKQHPICKRSIF